MSNNSRPSARRPPLGEATQRVNNSQQLSNSSAKLSPMPHHESLKTNGLLQTQVNGQDLNHVRDPRRTPSVGPDVANPRLSAIKDNTESNRNSQYSTTSTNSDGRKIKICIGPWKLGKTLGMGATARVRMARHIYTGQQAAIKIVQKKTAQISQAGSLADLDKADSEMPETEESWRRMPVGIEREVAIMKLIQHPNIMKLYDIWENRKEIYLVLEYADNGELFSHISRTVRLGEEEAIKYFRQILSAVGYCHSFKICHRDLKPENILLTKDGDIKIADFGMAALQQGPDHRLRTACGSPHYAAPELIKGFEYSGELVDVWSLGVVLFAMLAGRLPFDVDGSGDEWLPPLLKKIRKGHYEDSPEFSDDASNLIRKILQINPGERINLRSIWGHPLIRKYDYLDNLGRGKDPQSPGVGGIELQLRHKNDIHQELLRHLRSMWHKHSEQQLVDALLSKKPNEQKLFYSLLLKYRDAQLENYIPDLGHSDSDYHHVRPLRMKKTYSTCNFPPPKSGHGRQASRFTVISNAAETEQSYDPFKASKPQHLDASRIDGANVTVHRNGDNACEEERETSGHRRVSRASSAVTAATADRSGMARLAPPSRKFVSKSSLSSTRSRNSNGQIRVAAAYKRGVNFSHARKHSGNQRDFSAGAQPNIHHGRHSNHTEVTDDGGGDFLRPVSGGTPASIGYIRSRKAHSITVQYFAPPAKNGRSSQIWNEDVRQHSSSLAKDCDEAFNRMSMVSEAESEQEHTSFSRHGVSCEPSDPNPGRVLITTAKHVSLDSRPLPPAPARTESVKGELLEARKQAELRRKFGGDDSPGYLDRMVTHIDRLMQPPTPPRLPVDRRTSSAPVENRNSSRSGALPSIYEARTEEVTPKTIKERVSFLEHQRRVEAKNARIASAPEPRYLNRKVFRDGEGRPLSLGKNTIRVVQPSSPLSPVRPPAPLAIRKKSSQGGQPPSFMSGGNVSDKDLDANRIPTGKDLRQQYSTALKHQKIPDLTPIHESYHDDDRVDRSDGTIVRKKSGWFKRNSRSEESNLRLSLMESEKAQSKRSSNSTMRPSVERQQNAHFNAELPEPPKKKPFSLGRIFKKRLSKPDMSVSAHDMFEVDESMQDSLMDPRQQTFNDRGSHGENARARQVAPQQSWIAKLFHVKPVSRFICFSVSQKRARLAIVAVLKEWKQYGITNIQVNKERNIVFGKLGKNNYLDMKEVSFAGEIMTVIEHGKRSHLSIARFTQEQGAASSFLRVVETMENVLSVRKVLVTDERKARMMIKTLNAA